MSKGYYRYNRSHKPIPSPVTMAIVGITLVVTLLDFLGFDAIGENFALINYRLWIGEPWRLLSYSLVHANLIHVGMNLYMLWFLGLILEGATGRRAFLLVYVTSVLGGGIAISLMGVVMIPTVGASGGVYGLMGALISYMYSRSGSMRGLLQVPFGRSLLIVMGINLAISLAPGVSLLGHIGGLIPGLLLGYLIERYQSKRLAIGEKAGAVVLAAALIGGAIYATAPLHRQETQELRGAKHLGLEYEVWSVENGTIPFLTFDGSGDIDAKRFEEAEAISKSGSRTIDTGKEWERAHDEIAHYVRGIRISLKETKVIPAQVLIDHFEQRRKEMRERLDLEVATRKDLRTNTPFGR